MTSPTVREALGHEAAEELGRAMAKHAAMHSAHEGYAVILEELDELWDEVRAWQPGGDLSKMRKEAIQVAAMALRFVHDVVDRPAPPPHHGSACGPAVDALRELHPGADFS